MIVKLNDTKVDPTKVTRSALQNAASVAAMFLTTEAVVADKPEEHVHIRISNPNPNDRCFWA